MSTISSSRRSPTGRSSPPVAMKLLGHFELRVGGAVVALPAGPQRVLAYLALRGTTSRSRLAGELWPDATHERAMGCLRTAIWRVNPATHGLVWASGSALDLSPHAEVDVRRVIRASGALLEAAVPPAVATEPPAVELLPTWDDHWLVHDRERVRQLQLHALEAGSQRLMAAGRFGLGLDWALAAVRADPLRESAHRAVIRIHVAEGNITEARRAYDTCADLLRSELGVQPSARTREVLLAANRGLEMTML